MIYAQLYYANKWIDISSCIQSPQITLANRCDEAFGIGEFTFEIFSISEPIPAYSRLKIDNTMYLCSSSTTRKICDGTTLHNVEVLDSTAILSRFIVGSKNFSVKGDNRSDYQKVAILGVLMEQKYGIKISIENYEVLDKEEEYTFQPGTTYYDAICMILRNYNKRIKVVNITDTLIECILLDLEGSPYELDESRILNLTMQQNIDDYCKRLEGEMTNVIDRTNVVTLKNYTCRVEEIKLTEDNCKIILPTRIEKLQRFGVYSGGQLSFKNIKGEYLSIFRGVYSQAGGWDYEISEDARNLQYWISCMASSNPALDFPNYETPLYKIVQQFAEEYNVDFYSLLYDFNFKISWGERFVNSLGQYDYMFDLNWVTSNDDFDTLFFLDEWVVEKNKYDTFESVEKPKYAFYSSGDNHIDGMNVMYKDDFWSKITGATVQAFFSHHNVTGGTKFQDTESGMYGYLSNVIPFDGNPLKNKYYIEYYAITNPFISVEKTANMLNCSRSYSKGSNFIDFDKMINSMNICNSYLGKPELSIVLDVTDLSEFPQVTNKINYLNKDWYLSNYTISYTPNKIIMNMNLVSNYSKLADVIGVSTQFEETKNPIENIIERPVLLEAHKVYHNPDNLWLRFVFDNRKPLFKRACLLRYGDYKIIYCETIDHYCFDKTTSKEKLDVYTCIDVPYGDNNNEVVEVSIDIVEMPELSYEQSMVLPYYSGSYEVSTSLGNFYLYKDARERLLFTILLK